MTWGLYIIGVQKGLRPFEGSAPQKLNIKIFSLFGVSKGLHPFEYLFHDLWSEGFAILSQQDFQKEKIL
ncbi:MAG: hypothetical protein D6710_04260 [Nitrospirae bacterium]|nr:MAG: hypothetical protein D6710_04260 [Nitrospirota bacterium]